jgi:hypothetical protein
MDITLRGPEGGRAPGEGSVTSSPSFHPCARTKYSGGVPPGLPRRQEAQSALMPER